MRVGAQVRVDLHGRRIGGWVVATDVEPSRDLTLRPLSRVRGWGPEPEVVELTAWGAWRWAGARATLLSTASAEGAVRALPPPALTPPAPPPTNAVTAAAAAALAGGCRLLRLPPATDLTVVVAVIAQRGPTLAVVPSHARAATLAGRLRRAGAGVALVPGDWAQARAGAAVVVGARAAAWGPCPGLAAVVVIDSHDESLAQEQAPTWHAAPVAAERARRAGVPCVWVTPCPTVEQLTAAPLVTAGSAVEADGWGRLELVDRRVDDPRLGLYSERLSQLLRGSERVVCVLNRKGRGRLLASAACGTLASCERCGAAVRQQTDGDAPYLLSCPRCGTVRPPVCAECGSTVLRLLRVGVTRVREELAALAGRPVGEVTAAGAVNPDAPVLVGTEAVLRRGGRADVVAFLEFDQELLAPRLRAAEEALALLALAARMVGGRRGRLLVQTRVPGHPVLEAARRADPQLLGDAEVPVRTALRFPPASALASVSGPAAAALVEAVEALIGQHGSPFEGADVLAGEGDRWLVRAPDHRMLADLLAAAGRPSGRLRIEVDPQRV